MDSDYVCTSPFQFLFFEAISAKSDFPCVCFIQKRLHLPTQLHSRVQDLFSHALRVSFSLLRILLLLQISLVFGNVTQYFVHLLL
jgi:hypothetical protein